MTDKPGIFRTPMRTAKQRERKEGETNERVELVVARVETWSIEEKGE
jgi:hypothetical protein